MATVTAPAQVTVTARLLPHIQVTVAAPFHQDPTANLAATIRRLHHPHTEGTVLVDTRNEDCLDRLLLADWELFLGWCGLFSIERDSWLAGLLDWEGRLGEKIAGDVRSDLLHGLQGGYRERWVDALV